MIPFQTLENLVANFLLRRAAGLFKHGNPLKVSDYGRHFRKGAVVQVPPISFPTLISIEKATFTQLSGLISQKIPGLQGSGELSCCKKYSLLLEGVW
ncbi:hypothetical protein EUGRSUZ_B01473 [Eucalyptus grandis]|uniref:Uncharacterized protein n=2 Tax=Eucalyptus grandis TaxID=71139 RepID=A0ACC3LQP2_EUCGR|nr:hypothetical protein EUGRSUZ_B01473 [Eucalyptus grandis]